MKKKVIIPIAAVAALFGGLIFCGYKCREFLIQSVSDWVMRDFDCDFEGGYEDDDNQMFI